ncbi:EamA family transporter [Enterovirga rhinocerotis]|uniref:EamA-like transporter family protein n=1 Tax=Enterovirga rhinocerotis TaxID=1339210 RepID=A0A4R7C6V4_9HYPH|nr:EamA family transporter [Enterovirga rhinocerotis]TDR93873.1 EamA-like transporter family protein [Enterovirga rhinocerotis]
MEFHVFAAVLAAAALHAGWNAFLKLRLEPLLAMTLIMGFAGLVALPALIVLGLPPRSSWPWLATSIALHLAYSIVLTSAYARADMGQVYPIARGGAPLMTALASALLLQEPVSALQLFGIASLGLGVAAMSILGRRSGGRVDPLAIGLALLTAASICGYTLSDGLGARASGSPHAYTAALFVADGITLSAYAAWRRGGKKLREALGYWRQGVVGGTMSLASYWIAIWAMTIAPIALVAALRESSVLFAVAIAVIVVKEPLQWTRALAAVVILFGLVLVRLG